MVNLPPPGEGTSTEFATFSDFTGGLNLISDNFKLAPNESPEMLNVDVSRRGGITRRRGWVERTVSEQSRSPWAEASDLTANHMLMHSDQNKLFFWDGGANMTRLVRNATVPGVNETNVVDNAVVASDVGWTADYMGFATFGGVTYGTRGFQTVPETSISYDPSGVAGAVPSSVVALTDPDASAWQDDYDTPSGSHFPVCRYVAAHNDAMWSAFTYEGGDPQECRVRFSHPNDGGSWRENDFIDVDPGAGGGADCITALVPFRDHIVVFKRHSVYAIFGYSPETFQMVKVADEVGAVSSAAVANSEDGLYFFDEREGVYLYNGESVQWLFSQIEPALRTGDITQIDDVNLGWVNSKLWVNVRWLDVNNADAGRSFIWDPLVTSWTMYSGFLSDGGTGINNHQRASFMFDSGSGHEPYVECAYNFLIDVSSVCEVDVDSTYADSIAGGAFVFSVPSRYRTPWVDLGAPAMEKRWRRPEFIVSGGYDQTTLVEVLKDWNSAAVHKVLSLTTEAQGSSATWGSVNWGAFDWSAIADLYDIVVRGGAIGSTGRSLSFVFVAPDDANVWELNAYTIKWRNKRVKG